MDAVKAQLAKIQQQLGQLTASQKMLAASLVTVMVLSLLFWGKYAGSAEMEPVLDQAMKPGEISKIVDFVRARGIDAKVVSDRVVVPSDRRMELLAAMSYEQVLPNDTHAAYDEIIKQISPWDSQANTDAARNEAKARLVAAFIRNFPGVSAAEVMIDPTSERHIGGGRNPVASVQITLRDISAKPDKKLVQAAAATVAGAQSGLAMSKINVVVNGVSYPVTDRDAPGSFDGEELLAQQQAAERFYTDKIRNQIPFIEGALVSVTVSLNEKSESQSKTEFDPKTTVSKEKQSTNETSETKGDSASSIEPGVVPNSAMSIGAPAVASNSGGATSTQEKTSSMMENMFGSSKTETVTPAGKATVIGVAVNVPRSYIINCWRTKNRKAGNNSQAVNDAIPDEAVLEQTLVEEFPHIRKIVRRCTDLKNDEDVIVEAYNDTTPPLAAASVTTAAAAGASGITALITGHFKEVGVVVLALFSLFMVSSMVKKGTPQPIIAASAPVEVKSTPTLSALSDLAGDVSEGQAMLDGMELDDDSVRSQQMVEQVSTLVKENPDAAASLVKRWLSHA